jgi:RNA polymerase sigma-70 factor (ECF subfamily)
MTQTFADAEVIERVLGGDVEAFGMLVDRYQDEFAGFATLMTGNPDDAADVIQDSFVRAYHGLRGCRDRKNFKNWLFRIVSNQCKTHLARRRRRGHRPLEEAATVATAADPGREVESDDMRAILERALRALPPDQRELLVLKYVNELELQQMAPMLAISIPALKMRLLRARQALLAQLEGVLI